MVNIHASEVICAYTGLVLHNEGLPVMTTKEDTALSSLERDNKDGLSVAQIYVEHFQLGCPNDSKNSIASAASVEASKKSSSKQARQALVSTVKPLNDVVSNEKEEREDKNLAFVQSGNWNDIN